ncbi:MAG: tetratricopeptide repeat protein [Candidatus Omnitrophica bacterium]|nr:tetratricopeptide repeat protein [Candidatus Omnitrophota bacterium]MBU1995923.1 tetratricopeptide repeat protein [Candidatus Omnitrophota bacterium]MBU4333749.1 tetratricopeptide repeat protein [Candidatus Omnitrophota bacterium]
MPKRNTFLENLNRPVFSNAGVLVLIALVTFLCYFLILDAPFKTMDDYLSIVENPLIKSLDNAPQILKSSFFSKNTYWRPLVHLSFALEYKFFKLNAFYYYLNNIILHILASFGVFLVIDKLVKNRTAGILTGLLFAVHPVHWEQVTNISGRSILLCGLFFFYSFWMFLKAFGSGKARHVVLSLIFFCLSLLSKESAVMLPLCVIVYLWIVSPKEDRSQEQECNASFITNSFLIVTVAYLIFRERLGISGGFNWISFEHTLLSVITFLKALVIYLRLAIIPTGLYYDRSLDIFSSFWEPQVASTLVFWTIAFYFISKKWSSFSAGIKFLFAWTIINFAIVSQVIPVKVSFFSISTAEHFLYIPLAAMLAIMVLFLVNISKNLIANKKAKRSILILGAAGLYLFYILITIDQVVVSSNQITMFKQSFDKNPRNIRVITPLALAYAYAGMYESAEKYYTESLKVEPGNVRGLIGAGRALCDQGKHLEGLAYYNKVVDAGQFEGLLKENKYAAYAVIEKRYKEGLKNLKGRITDGSQKYDLARLHYSLGIIYHLTERIDKAILEYKRAITVRKDYQEAYMNLAAAYENNSQKKEAIETYNEILFNIILDEDKLEYVTKRLEKLNRAP